MGYRRFSKDEEMAVVDEAVRFMRAAAQRGDFPNMREVLEKAQGVLAEERRIKQIPVARFEKMAQQVTALLNEQLQVAAPKPQPTPEPEKPKQLDPIATVGAMFRELGAGLGDALAKAVVPAINAALREALSGVKINGQHHAAVPEEVAKPLPKGADTDLPAKFLKHKVCVIGFPESFRHNLAQQFPHLDMRFLNGDAPAHVAKATSANCEATFLMLKGSSHKVEQSLPNGTYTRVNGSQSDLKRILGARFPRTTAMEPAALAARH